MTVIEAKELRRYYADIIVRYMEAKIKLADGLVQSYAVDGLTLTRFDLKKITDTINDAIKKRDECDAIINSKSRRNLTYIIPHDN